MGWDNDVITEHLDDTLCVPAVGQGALAIECREDDKDLLQLLAHINDTITERTVARSEYFFINLKVDAKFQLLDMQPLQKTMQSN